MSGTLTMKVMLKDMFEFVDSVADILEIEHDESLEKLQKKSNNKFLQFNIFMMMTIVKSLLEDKADAPCNHCHQELKEENHELLEEKKSWQEGEFKLTKLLAEERTKNVELQKLLKESKEWNNKAVEEMEKIKKECCSKEIYDSVYKENQELLEEIRILKQSQNDNNLKRVIRLKEKENEELSEKLDKSIEESQKWQDRYYNLKSSIQQFKNSLNHLE